MVDIFLMVNIYHRLFLRAFFARFVFALLFFVFVFSVIENFAYRWIGIWGEFQQVEARVLRHSDRFADRYYSVVLSSFID